MECIFDAQLSKRPQTNCLCCGSPAHVCIILLSDASLSLKSWYRSQNVKRPVNVNGLISMAFYLVTQVHWKSDWNSFGSVKIILAAHDNSGSLVPLSLRGAELSKWLPAGHHETLLRNDPENTRAQNHRGTAASSLQVFTVCSLIEQQSRFLLLCSGVVHRN